MQWGAPFKGDAIDLTYVHQMSHYIGKAIDSKDNYHVVVVKSTVVPGATDSVVLPTLEQASGKQAGVDFGIGMNPEFLREGVAVVDFIEPDRIVLGGIDECTLDVMDEFYRVFAGVDVVRTSQRTADMAKYTLATILCHLNKHVPNQVTS